MAADYTVAFSDLNTLLQSLATNTKNTPYSISITGITAAALSTSSTADTLGYILKQNPTKYVDLSPTILSNYIVTSMIQTFENCTSLVKSPSLPYGVTSMSYTFNGCTSLIEPPVIPSTANSITGLFRNCISLTDISNFLLPATSSLSSLFEGCTGITDASHLILTNSLTSMSYTFYGCTSLTKVPAIPIYVSSLSGVFGNCSSLKSVYIKITDYSNVSLDNAFYGATSLDTIIVNSSSAKTSLINKLNSANYAYPSGLNLNNVVKVLNTVAFSDLNTYLQSLSANTVNTSCCLNITGLTVEDCDDSRNSGTLGYILNQNNTKYVDLSQTELPSSLTNLAATFMNCTSLVYAPPLPSNASNINYTYLGCTNLKEAPKLPSTTINLIETFRNCTSITQAPYIPSSVESLSGTFSGCTALSDISNIIIPNSVTIMTGTFKDCTSLTSIPNIPNSVTNLSEAFYGCTGLTDLSSLNIPNTVTSLSLAFYECTGLTKLPDIPSTVTNISNAFRGCTNLTSVTIDIADYTNVNIDNIFMDCTNLNTVYVPSDTAKSTLINKFDNNDFPPLLDANTIIIVVYKASLSDLNALLQSLDTNTASTPYKLNVIGLTASDCSSSETSGTLGYILKNNSTKYLDLSYTTLPNDLTNMSYAFYRCSSIVIPPTIPSNVTDITHIFRDCVSLTISPSLPTNITDMSYVFSGCSSLTDLSNLVIPSGVTNFDCAFNSCTALTSVPTIPSGATYLSNTFNNCTSLTTIKIDITDYTSVTTTYTFRDCASLESILVPSTTAKSTLSSKLDSSNFPSSLDASEVIKVIYTVAFSNLNTYLQSLDANTTSTPYMLNITGLTANNCKESYTTGTLGYILKQNSTKYVDLSYTELPNSLTTLYDSFNHCTSLIKSPIIPDGVTSLSWTFSYCSNFIYLPNIPNSVTNLYYAFYECTSLTSVPAIPNSVTNMGYAFKGCTLLTDVPNISTSVTDLSYSFQSCKALLDISSWVIPSTANMSYMFSGCSALTDASGLTISNGVTDMKYAFQSCSKLTTTPNIPNSVTNMQGTFYSCSKLTTINTLSNSITNLASTFRNCTSLTSTPTLPNTITDMGYSFDGCTKLATITNIPTSTIHLGYTFRNCTALTSVPNISSTTITDIREAFKNCSNLTSLSLEVNNVTTNTGDALYGCSNLSTLNLSLNKATSLDSAYFITCTSLSNLNLSINKVSYLGSLLSGKTSLTQLSFTDSTATDLSNMLKNCINLTTASINTAAATNLTSLFEGCTSLTSVTLTAPLSSNLTNAFKGCTSLTSMPTLSASTTNLDSTFEGCTGITAVDLTTSATTMNSTFKGCSEITNADITANSATNMTSIFENCDSLEEAELTSSSVINLTLAFKNCEELDTITLNTPNVINMTSTFENCDSLTAVPILPEHVINMTNTFKSCSGITATPSTVPSEVTNLQGTFEDCTSLRTGLSVIPQSVENMDRTYYNDTLLVSACRIPATVKSKVDTYYGCENLILEAPALSDYLTELIEQKQILVENLVTKGVEASSDEKFNTLVSKVLNIQGGSSGSGGGNEEPEEPEELGYVKMSNHIEMPTPDYSCTTSELGTLLGSLPANTVNTPYQIKITDISANSDFSTIASALSNNTSKYVSLLPTEIPSAVTSVSLTSCTNLICTPIIPESVETLSFDGCTGLKSIYLDKQEFSSMVLTDAFQSCTNIEEIYFPTNAAISSFLYNKDVLYNYIDCDDSVDLNTITQFVYGPTPDYTVAFSGLNALLQSLDANTVDTPYKIRVNNFTSYENLGSTWWDSGSLGYILNQNPTKFVDLSFTHLIHLKGEYDSYDPYDLLYGSFSNCTSLVSTPPSPTYGMCDTYQNCTNLKTITLKTMYYKEENYDWVYPLYSNDINAEPFVNFCDAGDSMDESFYGCDNVETVYVDNEATKTALYNYFEYDRTHSSSINYGQLAFTNEKMVVFDPTTITGGGGGNNNSGNNNQPVSEYNAISTMIIPDADYTCTLSELDSLLTSLTKNTSLKPYRIKVTGLTIADCAASNNSGTLGYIIRQHDYGNAMRYVDLLPTVLPNGITDLTAAFDDCENLVVPPIIPRSVTDLSSAFQDTPITKMYLNIEDFTSVDVSGFINTESSQYNTLESIFVPSAQAKQSLESVIDSMNNYQYNSNDQIKVYTGYVEDQTQFMVLPYSVIKHGGWVSDAGYYEMQTNSKNTTLFFKVKASHTYICMLGDVVGTRFRWMFTTTDISTNDQSIQGTSAYTNSTIKAFMTFQYTPSTDGFLVGTVDNQNNEGVMAYLMDWTLMQQFSFDVPVTDAT